MKLNFLNRRCPACRDHAIPVRRYLTEPVNCDSCGQYFRRVLGWSLFWRYALPELAIWLLLFVLLVSIVEPLSWTFAIGLLILLGPFIADGFLPLRPIPAPAITVYSRRHRALQYLLIALPFLQLVLPFVGRENYETNLPVAVALAFVAAAVIVYCTVLNGRYLFYRAMRRGRSSASLPELPRVNLVFTLVIPALWAWLSLVIFYLQIRRLGSSLREFALISFGTAIALVVSLWACHWAGTRHHYSSLRMR